jgi:GNAT superfamily N-acetyltransferase
MDKIFNYQEINDKIKFLKEGKKGIITNFYPDIEVVTRWINSGDLCFYQHAETLLLLRSNKDFMNLYFVSASNDSLQSALIHLNQEMSNIRLVADLVGKMHDIGLTSDVFVKSGFAEYTRLCRMSRKISENDHFAIDSHILPAKNIHAKSILDLLYTYFDPVSEQLPGIDEVKKWITNGNIFIYLSDDQILGFVIYINKGYSSYLRYWFVHPEHRDKKIGSALLNKYFSDSKDARLMFFWVILSNENAVFRYKHYGFQMENFYDIVLTKNLINNETENN